jgi:prevent-host-death family protein
MGIQMRTVNVAELKNRLSAYLRRVRAGEEILIRDRNLPVAKLVPLSGAEISADELALVATGELALPSRPLDEESFWRIGEDVLIQGDFSERAAQAVSDDRDERDAGLLGR